MISFHTRGWTLLSLGFLLSVIGWIIANIYLGLVLLVIGVFEFWFHRDPIRETPDGATVVSPTDGTVRRIEDIGEDVQVTVYLGLSDVHFIRSLRTGTIETVTQESEPNLPALFSMSEKNNRMRFQYEVGDEVVMYTGVLARRLLSLIEPKVNLSKGAKIGLISFGSRVQFTITGQSIEDLEISVGDSVTAGETVVL